MQHLYRHVSDPGHSLNRWRSKAHNIYRDHVLRNIPTCTALQVLIHFRDQPDPSDPKPLPRSKLSVHGNPKKQTNRDLKSLELRAQPRPLPTMENPPRDPDQQFSETHTASSQRPESSERMSSSTGAPTENVTTPSGNAPASAAPAPTPGPYTEQVQNVVNSEVSNMRASYGTGRH